MERLKSLLFGCVVAAVGLVGLSCGGEPEPCKALEQKDGSVVLFCGEQEPVRVRPQPGAQGMSGVDGQDGATALIQVSEASMCEHGGELIEAGVDDDSDGELGADEVDSSMEICHGARGEDGSNGLNSLIDVSPEPAGAQCERGGHRFEVGLDLNQNDVLDPDEVDPSQTFYMCAP